VSAREHVSDGACDVVGRGEPVAGARVQPGDVVVRARLRELATEDLPEDMVVAEPLATPVERNEEEVRPLDLAEHPPRRVVATHRITQRGTEPIEHAGVEQEPPRLRLLRREDLVAEVLHEVSVEPQVVGAARPGAVAQREPGQVEPGDPALGPRPEQLELLGRERQRQRVVEQRRRLGVAEPQLIAQDLAELTARAQTGDVNRRLDPCRDHEM
jgi:hypothetical protein